MASSRKKKASLYEPFIEVAGNVKWSASDLLVQPSTFLSGKLCLNKLGDLFYFQLVFDTGRKPSRVVKIAECNIENLVCRNGRFSVFFKQRKGKGGTNFILSEGDTAMLEHLTSCLKTMQQGGRPDGVKGEKPDVKSKPKTEYRTPQKCVNVQQLPSSTTRSKPPASPLSTRNTNDSANASVVIAPDDESSHNTKHKSPNRQTSPRTTTPEQKLPPKHQTLSTKKMYTKKVSNDIQHKTQKATKLQDNCNKENIGIVDESPFSFPSAEKDPVKAKVASKDDVCTPIRERSSNFYGDKSKPNMYSIKYGSESKRQSVSTPIRRGVLSGVPCESPTKKPSSQKKFTPRLSVKSYLSQNEVTSQGFDNIGNTCYMNAILQSLFNLTPFIQDLSSMYVLERVNPASLIRCMYNLYCCKDEDVKYSSRKNSYLRKVKNAIAKSEITTQFSGTWQNDAHEYMNICLDQMKEEVRKALVGNLPESEHSVLQTEHCPVVRNFDGCIRTFIRCCKCGDLVTKDEMFNHLSLNIPHSSKDSPVANFSLEKLLEWFFRVEEVERKCDKCGFPRAAHYSKVQSLPRVMIFHVLRSAFTKKMGSQKNSEYIHSNRYIDMGVFCNSDVKDPTKFLAKNRGSLSKTSLSDNETPISEADDFVATKSRRRLDLSMCETTPKSTKPTDDSLPDWVQNYKRPTTRPRLSPFPFPDDSEEEQIRQATLESLKTAQPAVCSLNNMSEEEQLQLATLESLKTERESSEDERQLQLATLESLKTKEKASQGILEVDFDEFSCGMSDEELLEYAEHSGETEQGGTQSKKLLFDDQDKVLNQKQRVGKDVIENAEGMSTSSERTTSRKRPSTSELNTDSKDSSVMARDPSSSVKDGQTESITKRRKTERKSPAKTEVKSTVPPGLECDMTEGAQDKEKPSESVGSSADHQYRLVSIVNHIGMGTQSGHYISDVLDLSSEQWIRYNDTRSEKITEHLARFANRGDSYIFFYMHKSLTDQLLPRKP